MNELWFKAANIDISTYDLPEDMCKGDWINLLNDLIEAYADYLGWTIDRYWQDNPDWAYLAESAAYEVLAELREKYE